MYEQNKLSASLPAHDIQPRQSEDIGTVLTHAHNFLVDLTIAHDASTGAIYETSWSTVEKNACSNYCNH